MRRYAVLRARSDEGARLLLPEANPAVIHARIAHVRLEIYMLWYGDCGTDAMSSNTDQQQDEALRLRGTIPTTIGLLSSLIVM